MRKLLPIFFLVAVLYSIPTEARLPNSVSVGYSSNAKAPYTEGKASSFSFGYIRNYEESIFEVGAVFIDNGSDVPDHQDYAIPHNSFTDLGTKQDGNEIGMYFEGGKKFYENFAWIGSLGVTRSTTINLVRSNATGIYYQNSENNHYNGLLGAGVGFYPGKGIGFEVKYNNREKLTFSVNL